MSNQRRLLQLSSEQKECLKKELEELYQWKDDESKNLEARLRKEGKWDPGFGLDVNQHHFREITEEFQRRFHDLGVKYDILSEGNQQEDEA